MGLLEGKEKEWCSTPTSRCSTTWHWRRRPPRRPARSIPCAARQTAPTNAQSRPPMNCRWSFPRYPFLKALKHRSPTLGKFHQSTGIRCKCTSAQSWAQQMLFYFINRKMRGKSSAWLKHRNNRHPSKKVESNYHCWSRSLPPKSFTIYLAASPKNTTTVWYTNKLPFSTKQAKFHPQW